MTELTIVVPAYNESSVLDAFHARALAVLDGLELERFAVIFTVL